ncbi:MAG: hypothetical protein LWW75_07800 [Chlorobiales bacterium]|nr:hypothetical protein [Chlorobiales bacterium]
MTEESFKRKVECMANDVRALIIEKADTLLKSGGVSLDDYAEDSCLLPKLFICAMGDEIKWQFYPTVVRSRRHSTFIKNISKFI